MIYKNCQTLKNSAKCLCETVCLCQNQSPKKTRKITNNLSVILVVVNDEYVLIKSS